jgi:hypothetical protein
MVVVLQLVVVSLLFAVDADATAEPKRISSSAINTMHGQMIVHGGYSATYQAI